ncbi:barstar family protein [Gimesia sp.]|uniref:barstar family protein n=1 Tax=Gimesia sp. TaxID=2024833 RepID=UPI000C46CD76|nr:barstar family protein [Gimesia sp.]MAX35830.1 hypothetical protein [Gimesia sp.]|tara:strand:- start:14156 stop:14641 length:486 start_codon:yes stop_codon:yes gene_type:complete
MEKELDYQILADGPVTKYYSIELLDQHQNWFSEHGYQIYCFDAKTWYSRDNFYSDIHDGFEFPEYFGRNWDAFNDCISDMVSENGKVLVVIKNFDRWHQEDLSSAMLFLNYMVHQTYQFLLEGKRWITLIQSNTPSLDVSDAGAMPVYWNRKEWMNKDRGL